jgi:hypothetical protein
MVMAVSYSWRGQFSNEALNTLRAEAFGRQNSNDDWWAQVNRHSLRWVCANLDEVLVGFVNVVWDGGFTHSFWKRLSRRKLSATA